MAIARNTNAVHVKFSKLNQTWPYW